MYVLASNMWFTTLIRQFFFLIDRVVYNFISSIYDVLIAIARTSVFSQGDIMDMADRIYKLLAIFMVFKVTLSLITYVVNPDDFSDKSKGISKLSKNIIISLALLILTPKIFNYAFELQTIILKDNSLSALVFGEEGTSGNESFFNTAGDKMAYTTISAFYSPNLSLDNLIDCDVLLEDTGRFSESCHEALSGHVDVDGTLFSEQTLKTYEKGVELGNFGLIFRDDMVVAKNQDNDAYIMDYKFVFSTVVGVVIILLLISFCMDIALRSIKLGFLQLIAPIPIVSYVDPKSGKDGLFKKWYDMCFKTYLSLFIRLLAIYFAVYIIQRVSALRLVDVVDGSYVTNGIISIFVIIGALMFAKQLPKLLEGLGIKLDGAGKFTLNPLKKLENEALGGKILKKPNEMLAKGAKALAKAPIAGASLGARKLMAGVDSAAHGKGFWNGTKNVQGKLAQAKNKFMEKNLPHTAKSLKDKKEARENIRLRDNQMKLGKKYWMDSNGQKRNSVDAEREFLKDVNSEYRESYEFMSQKKRQMHKANAQAETYINAIKDGKLVGDARIALAKKLNLDEMATDDQLIQGLNKYSGTAEKQYKEAEARHAEMKKMYKDSAEKEAAYDYYDKMDPDSEISELPNYNPTEEDNKQNLEEPESNESTDDGQSSEESESNESTDDGQSSEESESGETETKGTEAEDNVQDSEDDHELTWNKELREKIEKLNLRNNELQEQWIRLTDEYNDADTSVDRKNEIRDELDKILTESRENSDRIAYLRKRMR